jgi:hypothetical protein
MNILSIMTIAVTNCFLDIMGDATCHLHEVGPTP